MDILALNCGSSSVKYQLYDWKRQEVIAKGMVERVTIGDSYIIHEVPGRETYREEYECPDHQVAIHLIIKILTDKAKGVVSSMEQISAVGHRVVHGGEKFTCSVRIDDKVLDAIKEVQHLAPLHNPPNISGNEAAQSVLPDVPHIAIFDTAFHQTMPKHAYTYAVPYEWYEKHGVRRYGFHGTSHLYVSKRAAAMLGKDGIQLSIVDRRCDLADCRGHRVRDGGFGHPLQRFQRGPGENTAQTHPFRAEPTFSFVQVARHRYLILERDNVAPGARSE